VIDLFIDAVLYHLEVLCSTCTCLLMVWQTPV